MKLKKCRNCQGKKLSKLFSLGKLSYTGKFPKNINTNIKKTELTLVMCNKCSLVQLNNNYNLKIKDHIGIVIKAKSVLTTTNSVALSSSWDFA